MNVTTIDTLPDSIVRWCEWWSSASLLSYHSEVERLINNNNNFNVMAMKALVMPESSISSHVANSILFHNPEDLCPEVVPSGLWCDIAFKLLSNNSTLLKYLPNLGWHPKSLYYTYGRSAQTQEPNVNSMILLMEYAIALFYRDAGDPLAIPEFYEWGRLNNVATKEYVILFQSMYDIDTIKWADALKATLHFVQNNTIESLDYTHNFNRSID